MNNLMMIRRSRSIQPVDHLVFHHPLTSNLATLPTGQTMTKSGTVNFGTYQGKAAANFAASGYLKTTSGPYFDWTKGVTYSVWAYFGTSGGTRTFISAGSNTGLSMSRNNSNQYNVFGNTFTATIGQNAWHHIVATFGADKLTIKIYRDGTKVGVFTRAQPLSSLGDITEMAIGNNVPGYSYATRPVNMTDARIYDYAMTEAEIAELYAAGDNPQ